MPGTDVKHSERLLEAETAEAYGISFDDKWYGIPVLSREQMIAARLASMWIESLVTKKAIRNAKQSR